MPAQPPLPGAAARMPPMPWQNFPPPPGKHCFSSFSSRHLNLIFSNQLILISYSISGAFPRQAFPPPPMPPRPPAFAEGFPPPPF